MLIPALILLGTLLAEPGHAWASGQATSAPLVRSPAPARGLSKRDPLSLMPMFDTYGVQVQIGTPPQTIRVSLQTKEIDMILFDASCTECQTSPQLTLFNRDASSSYVNESGYFDILDSLWATGDSGSDAVVLGGRSLDKAMFVSLDSVTGKPGDNETDLTTYLENWAPGILGIGMRLGNSTDSGTKAPLIQTAAATWPESVLGLYLAQGNQTARSNSDSSLQELIQNSGEITFGGVNPSHYTGTFTNLTSTNTFDTRLDALLVDNKPLDIANASWSRHQLVNDLLQLVPGDPLSPVVSFNPSDSFLRIMAPVAKQLYSHIPGAAPLAPTNDYSEKGMYTVPCDLTTNVTFIFGGTSISMNPVNLRYRAHASTECIGSILAVEAAVTLDLGAPFLRNVYTALKYTNPPQVGFARLAEGNGDWGMARNATGAATGGGSAATRLGVSLWAVGGAAVAGWVL